MFQLYFSSWQGGGISRNDKRKVFNYMYSTAPQVPTRIHFLLWVKLINPALGYWWILFWQLGWVSLSDVVHFCLLQPLHCIVFCSPILDNEYASNECRWNGPQVVDWDFMQACEMAVCQCMVWATACLSPGSMLGTSFIGSLTLCLSLFSVRR